MHQYDETSVCAVQLKRKLMMLRRNGSRRLKAACFLAHSQSVDYLTFFSRYVTEDACVPLMDEIVADFAQIPLIPSSVNIFRLLVGSQFTPYSG
jgi:hypothetical protein